MGDRLMDAWRAGAHYSRMEIALTALLVASAASAMVLVIGVGLALYRGWRPAYRRLSRRRRVPIE